MNNSKQEFRNLEIAFLLQESSQVLYELYIKDKIVDKKKTTLQFITMIKQLKELDN